MSVNDYIREVMLSCPYIEITPLDFHIDKVDEAPISYSIEAAPNNPIRKKYLNGDTERLCPFQLVARRYFISDEEREDTMSTYEKISLWAEQQSRQRQLPPMHGGNIPKKLECVGSAFVMAVEDDSDSAIYTMQMHLIYYNKANNN